MPVVLSQTFTIVNGYFTGNIVSAAL